MTTFTVFAPITLDNCTDLAAQAAAAAGRAEQFLAAMREANKAAENHRITIIFQEARIIATERETSDKAARLGSATVSIGRLWQFALGAVDHCLEDYETASTSAIDAAKAARTLNFEPVAMAAAAAAENDARRAGEAHRHCREFAAQISETNARAQEAAKARNNPDLPVAEFARQAAEARDAQIRQTAEAALEAARQNRKNARQP